MKVFISFACLAFAAAASAEVLAEESPVYNYHMKFGIKEAARIKAEESAIISGERIVGGQHTQIAETPYQAGLVMTVFVIFTSVCGASLISNTHLITAAHCKHDGQTTTGPTTVVLGSNFLFFGGHRISNNDLIMHPEWDPSTAKNDIAVIILEVPVTFSNVIQPIALPSGDEVLNDFVGYTALASGFGRTSDSGSIGNDQQLSSVNLNVITNALCAETYGPFVHASNVCTSGEGGRGTCGGDSGGPLAVEIDGKPTLIGVTSYGAQAGCSAGYPAAFARVTSFISWINSK